MIQLEFLIALALQAGTIIRDEFNLFSKADSSWKKDETPVTKADLMINKLVLQNCKQAYPFVSVIAEEGSSICDSDWVIYCDPLDGTIPFATGLSLSTFCISALYKGTVILSVIYDAFMHRMYTAEKGKGAFLNKTKIIVSPQATLDSKTHASLVWWKNCPYDLTSAWTNLQNIGVKCMNLNTIGIVGGLIAAGQFEASIFPGDKVLETAAMSLLVEEAGGRCTDLQGNKIDFLKDGKMNGHVITNGFLHEEVLRLI